MRVYRITPTWISLPRPLSLAHATAILLGKNSVMAYVSTLPKVEKDRYLRKLSVLYTTNDPENDHCCGNGVLEIKCPYKYRSQSPTDEEPLSDKEYCLTKSPSTGAVNLSFHHKYYYQVQGQIALCKVDYCDFVCWTEKGAFIERIKRNDDFINTMMIPQLKSFFIEIMLPELLTMNVCQPPTPESTTENEALELFCVCRKPEYGDMIACDNPSCTTPDEWYHYKCVKIKSTPRKWYCLHCKN